MSESETAELCRKLYRRHKQAFDLIFEHRTDLQADLFEMLKQLVLELSPEVELDHCTKGSVRFAPKNWDKSPDQLSGAGRTNSKRVLLFEFRNSPDFLVLKLYIGPGDKNFRSLLWEKAIAEKSIFTGVSPKLHPKWTQNFSAKFLTKKDYEDPSFEQLAEKIQKRWGKFVTEDYRQIKIIIDSLILS